MLTFNEESKKHIQLYKIAYNEACARQKNLAIVLTQEIQRRNRETRDISINKENERDNSSGGGSRVRGSLNRETTPSKP